MIKIQPVEDLEQEMKLLSRIGSCHEGRVGSSSVFIEKVAMIASRY